MKEKILMNKISKCRVETFSLCNTYLPISNGLVTPKKNKSITVYLCCCCFFFKNLYKELHRQSSQVRHFTFLPDLVTFLLNYFDTCQLFFVVVVVVVVEKKYSQKFLDYM